MKPSIILGLIHLGLTVAAFCIGGAIVGIVSMFASGVIIGPFYRLCLSVENDIEKERESKRLQIPNKIKHIV